MYIYLVVLNLRDGIMGFQLVVLNIRDGIM